MNSPARSGRPSIESFGRLLRVSSSPYVVVHDFVNRSHAHALRAEVTAALEQCSETGEGMDRRRLGAGSEFPLTRLFERDEYLAKAARRHLGRPVNVKAQAGLTRAGENSGGGWHKDTLRRGIKALLYLDDVDSDNGPFTMLRNYDDRRLAWSPDAVSGARRRLNESVVERACREGGSRADELHAPMGTLIIFEISSAHRGTPSRRGERVTLTNYYKVAKASTVCRAGQHVTDGPFRRVGK